MLPCPNPRRGPLFADVHSWNSPPRDPWGACFMGWGMGPRAFILKDQSLNPRSSMDLTLWENDLAISSSTDQLDQLCWDISCYPYVMNIHTTFKINKTTHFIFCLQNQLWPQQKESKLFLLFFFGGGGGGGAEFSLSPHSAKFPLHCHYIHYRGTCLDQAL